jgi:hypothetical protein
MRILLLVFTLIVAVPAFAQTEFSLYRLNGNLAQANMLNPAFAPNSKIIIGLPVVSSIYVSVDNDGIAFRDLFKTSDTDELSLDTVSIFSKLKASQQVKFNEAIQLFYLGLRGKKGYLSFAIHQVSETRFHYPGDLVGWAIRGPASSHYVGQPLDLGKFYGKSIVYNKVSLNYARDITPKLRIGARYSYLLGVAAAETSRVSGSLTMSIDSVSLNTGSIQTKTAGIDFFNQDDLENSDYKNYLLKTKNKGMSIDLGATYDLTDKLTLSASVNDLGYINWKDYTRNYTVDPINYTFRGFDVLDYLNQDPGEEFLQAELDSLENLYKGTETTGEKFKTSLIGKFYAGVNFKVLKVNNFSALLYLDLFQKKIDPAVSLGYNIQLGRLLNATVGLTYQNGKINNIGGGLALKLTHMQVYATSDRANSFVYPARASKADIHLGMNLIFGRAKKKDKEKKEDEVTEEPVVEDSVVTEEPVMETPQADTTTSQAAASPIQPKTQTVEVNDTQTVTDSSAVVTEAKPVIEPPVVQKYEVVKKGTHEDELHISHYVIVGAFGKKENAQRYSELLKDQGYDNSFGYVTDKSVYHVYVFESSDLEKTRMVRDQFRKLSGFQFGQSWVLTVQE